MPDSDASTVEAAPLNADGVAFGVLLPEELIAIATATTAIAASRTPPSSCMRRCRRARSAWACSSARRLARACCFCFVREAIGRCRRRAAPLTESVQERLGAGGGGGGHRQGPV